MIYYLKHIDIEGPGTLGDFFKSHGLPSRTIELYDGTSLPEKVDDQDIFVILGGPMNVYEEEKYPFLKAETQFIQEIIKRDILTIGLCLGAQLIAKAAGARVCKSPVKEIGFRRLTLTPEGVKDPVFAGIESPFWFFEWHEDTFDLPDGAQLLLEGSDCRNQAFRLGSKVYGFQGHMEVSRTDVLRWVDFYISDSKYRRVRKKIENDLSSYEENFCQISQKIYNNLLKSMPVFSNNRPTFY